MKHKIIFFIVLVFTSYHSSAQESFYEDEFVIAQVSFPSSLDPHYEYASPTFDYAYHCFSTLFSQKRPGGLEFILAHNVDWPDEKTLVIHLRDDVKFHSGENFTSKDVAYSIDRVRNNKESQFAHTVNKIEKYEIVDDFTIRLMLEYPTKTVLNDLSSLFILSHHLGNVSHEEMTAPEKIDGTGPYRFMGRDTNGDLKFTAFEDYFGEKPYLKHVRLRHMPDREQRFAAFAKGEVHLVGKMTPSEITALGDNAPFNFTKITSYRVIFLQFDLKRDQSPGFQDLEGRPLKQNPLKNPLVRQAISQAIDRSRLVKDVLGNAGIPAAQLLPKGVIGHNPRRKPEHYNPEQAKILLAKAGFADGFKIVLNATSDRYMNDEEINNSIASMLTKVGLKTEVKSYPLKEFLPELLGEPGFSAYKLGFSTSGRLGPMLNLLLHTRDPDNKRGTYNAGSYSNPEADRLIQLGLKEQHEIRRMRYLSMASEIVLEEYGIIPLYFEASIWGLPKGFIYDPARGESTLAIRVKKN